MVAPSGGYRAARHVTPLAGKTVALILSVVALVLVLGGGTALYAYDGSREDVLAEGLEVGGVNVGGMTVRRARAAVERQLVEPLERGIAVQWRGRSFELNARRARVRVDVEGMLRQALARSREGSFVGRAVRDLTGGEIRADIPARLSYSRPAVTRLVARVKRTIDRPPKDAGVTPSTSRLYFSRARNGRSVRARALRRKVVHALLHPGDVRTLRPPIVVTRPKVRTRRQVAAKYPWYITIDRSSFRLRVFRRLRLVEDYVIAVGQAGYDSPPGLHRILDKQVNPAWHVPPDAEWAGSLRGRTIPPGVPQNPLRARWMAYAPGGFGIHGTSEVGSLGSRASHGCIRMSVPDVIDLYGKVPLGTPVYLGG